MGAKRREFGVGARIIDPEVRENGVELTGQKAKRTGADRATQGGLLPGSADVSPKGIVR
jgi:hypothetical protein